MTTILTVTGNPSSYASGVWPESTMDHGVWRFSFTTTGASGSGTYSTFHSLFCGPVVGGTSGGIWIVNDALELFDTSDNQVFSQSMTFSASQTLTFTINVPAKTVTIAGATTGNGTFSFANGGPYFNAGTTLTAGGVTGDPGFTISGTFSNITDLAPDEAWVPVLPASRIARALCPALLSMTVAPVAPPAAAIPVTAWAPTYQDRIQPRRQPQHVSVAAPPFAGGQALTVGDAGIRQNILSALTFSGNPLTTFATDLTVAVDNTTDTLTATAHAMVMGAGPFLFATTGTFPGNTDGVTPYYASVTGANTFKLSTSATNAVNGTVVNITSNGTGTITLQRTRSTAPLYSTFVTVFARGDQASSPNQSTDSLSNTYTYVTGFPRAYDNFANSSASVAIKISGRGGALHTWSASIGNVGGNEDEVTIGGLEIFHAPILQSSSVVERADGSGATIASGTVTTTARALLVAIIFGNGNVNQDHTFTFLDGFAKVPRVCAEGDLNPSGYIQVEVATKLVEIKGTYSFRAQGTSSEGGQMALLAFQAVTSDLQPLDWLSPQPVVPTRRRPSPLSGAFEPPFVLPPPAPSVAAWSPRLPDGIRPRRPAIASDLAGPISTDQPIPWLPRLVDVTAHSRGPQLVSGPVAPPPDTNAGPLTWAPTFPDRTATRSWFVFYPVTAPVLATTAAVPALSSWSPSFPGSIPRRSAVVVDAGAVAPVAPPAIGLGWLPVFSDAPARPRGAVSGGSVAPETNPSSSSAPALSWLSSYPDATWRPRGVVSVGGATAPMTALPSPGVPAMSWSPTFPESTLRAHSAPIVVAVAAPDSWLLDAPPLSWMPKLHDAPFPPRSPFIVGGSTAPEAVLPNPPAPEISWSPAFPDYLRRPRAALIAGGSAAPEILPRKAKPMSQTPVGTSLLDGFIAKQVASALGAAKMLKPATLIKITPGIRTPGAVSGGTNPTRTSYTAKGIEQNVLSLELAGTLIAGANAAIRLFGATIAGGQVPVPNDLIVMAGVTYTIVAEGVSRDPASVSYLCQCKG